jgi:NadR type nicotinamide-nucleotide adenylyltransferase
LSRTVKIVLIGPESSGKSTLAKQLAAHYRVPFVAEYARTYLENKAEPVYDWAELETIARGQAESINQALGKKPAILFCDTDLLTLHIWSLDKFDKPIPFVEAYMATMKADLYLLCKPDLPWEPDPLREDSTRRDELYNWNLWLLRELNAQVVEVSGLGKQRFQNALDAVGHFLAQKD